MRHPLRASIMGCILFVASGCGNMPPLLRPTGDLATIELTDGTKHDVELLFCRDSTLYVLTDLMNIQQPAEEYGERRFLALRAREVKCIEIDGYANRTWVGPWVAFQVLPTVLLTISGASEMGWDDAPKIFAIFSAPTLLTGFVFLASTPPPPTFEEPLTPEKVGELKKYCRFPQGLTEEQLEQLATSLQTGKVSTP